MAKKVTKPIDVLNVNPSEFQWETFISNIVNGKYILVLGSEIMLSRTEIAECDGDSTKLLFNSVKEDLIDNNHIGRDNRAANFTELSYNVPDINRCIRNMVNEGLEFKIGEMSHELIALIRTKLFRVVLTTTTDPYIEVLMREVWGDELKVMDINSDFSSSEFDFDKYYRDDLSAFITPTLYYVFGKASSSKFVATDNDAIEIMAKWMSKDAPHNFLTYVRTKRKLALGCKFDDWLFRFFWYVLQGNVRDLSLGEVAISLSDSSETDNKLKTYLNQSKIYFKPDAREFISQTLDNLTAFYRTEDSRLMQHRNVGGVFLSYAHEDVALVKLIYYKLTEIGIPVWFDMRRLQGGDEFNQEISSAISECRIFIPVLSSQVQADFEENNCRFYKDVEWSQVQTLINGGQSISVIPLRIWGYDVRKNAEHLPDFIKGRTIHDLEYQTINELIFRLKEMSYK